jgi:hypothetical protein
MDLSENNYTGRSEKGEKRCKIEPITNGLFQAGG